MRRTVMRTRLRRAWIQPTSRSAASNPNTSTNRLTRWMNDEASKQQAMKASPHPSTVGADRMRLPRVIADQSLGFHRGDEDFRRRAPHDAGIRQFSALQLLPQIAA